MRTRVYVLFLFYTLFFAFYPGASHYLTTISFHRDLLSPPTIQAQEEALADIPFAPQATYPPVSAGGVYVVEAKTLAPVLAVNEHEKRYPASTTKIITALVAVDVFSPDQIVTVQTVQEEGQVMGLFAGEEISVENLLYGILVHSGNDAAYAIADAYGYDKFIALMNKKAEELGMSDSHFTNPAGLDHPAQQTTPFDLAVASRELLKNPYLRKIVGTKEITISDANYEVFHKLSNVNKLLGEIQGIGGLKTGYTEFAGENLVSLYRHEGHEFLIVILQSQDRFADTRTIVSWIDQNVAFINPNMDL